MVLVPKSLLASLGLAWAFWVCLVLFWFWFFFLLLFALEFLLACLLPQLWSWTQDFMHTRQTLCHRIPPQSLKHIFNKNVRPLSELKFGLKFKALLKKRCVLIQAEAQSKRSHQLLVQTPRISLWSREDPPLKIPQGRDTAATCFSSCFHKNHFLLTLWLGLLKWKSLWNTTVAHILSETPGQAVEKATPLPHPHT